MYVHSWIARGEREGKATRRREGCPEAEPSLPMSVSQPEIAYRAQTISYFTFPPSSNPSSATFLPPRRFAIRHSACTAFHVFFMLYPLFTDDEVRTLPTRRRRRRRGNGVILQINLLRAFGWSSLVSRDGL